MNNIKQNIAANIASLISKGITQAELAEMLNYSDKAVSKWERGESVPDICTLKQISDIFGISIDTLISHPESTSEIINTADNNNGQKRKNRLLVTGISILGVWFIALFCFLLFLLISDGKTVLWQNFIIAVPISAIVALVLNSVWGKNKLNMLIVSVLMWSVLASICLLFIELRLWLILILGVPGQLAILLSFRIRLPKSKKP